MYIDDKAMQCIILMMYIHLMLYKYWLGATEITYQPLRDEILLEMKGSISVPSGLVWAMLQKHSPRLFCCMKTPSPYTKSRKGLKTNRRNFLDSICRIHGFNFMSRPFLIVIGIKRSLVMFCCSLKLCYICSIWFYSSINFKSL